MLVQYWNAFMAQTKKQIILLAVAAIISLAVAGWFFLWVLSLAHGHCQGGWIHLWNTPGCKNSVYAQTGLVLAVFSSVVLFLKAVWILRGK